MRFSLRQIKKLFRQISAYNVPSRINITFYFKKLPNYKRKKNCIFYSLSKLGDNKSKLKLHRTDISP